MQATDPDACTEVCTEDAVQDPWLPGAGRLRSLVAYGCKVFHLRERFAAVEDSRRRPVTPAPLVSKAVSFAGLLRARSFNALEPKLDEKPFLRLVGAAPNVEHLCSADTLGRSLVAMKLGSVRQLSTSIVSQAERNKVFREGWHGSLRYVALDGWEPFNSYHRHCPHCLVRRVKVKQRDGSVQEVEQYFHRYVVAMLIDDRYDLPLDIEPLLPRDLAEDRTVKDGQHEGELPAAMRLLTRVKRTFGWLDVVVGDALYANGPFLTLASKLRMGAVVVAKKEKDEPLKEARALWGDSPPQEIREERGGHECIELWDCPGVETLSTYDGPIRVVRARITKSTDAGTVPKVLPSEAGGCQGGRAKRSWRRLLKGRRQPVVTSTWCMLATGKAEKLASHRVLAVARGRWHEELTGFNQWVAHWRFGHVFVHDGAALLNLFWLFFAAFNLLTLFLYRQVRSYGRDRGRDVTRTISRFIDELNDDLARLDVEIWDFG